MRSKLNKVEEFAFKYGLDSQVVMRIKSTNDDIAMTVIDEELSDRARTPSAHVSRVLQDQIHDHDEAEWCDDQEGSDAQRWNKRSWAEYGHDARERKWDEWGEYNNFVKFCLCARVLGYRLCSMGANTMQHLKKRYMYT